MKYILFKASEARMDGGVIYYNIMSLSGLPDLNFYTFIYQSTCACNGYLWGSWVEL